jgi:hypothetical protein
MVQRFEVIDRLLSIDLDDRVVIGVLAGGNGIVRSVRSPQQDILTFFLDLNQFLV